jgi:hypothetical protein
MISLNEFKKGVSKILMLDREVPVLPGTRVLKYLRAVLIIGIVLGVSVVSIRMSYEFGQRISDELLSDAPRIILSPYQ